MLYLVTYTNLLDLEETGSFLVVAQTIEELEDLIAYATQEEDEDEEKAFIYAIDPLEE